MVNLTEFLQDHMELSTQRKVFLLSFYMSVTLLVYVYFYSLLTLVLVVLVLWYTYDYVVEVITAPNIDPAGRYVFITGCDSGFGLDSAKAIRDLGFQVIAGCYNDASPGAKELKERPWVKKVEVVQLDVTSEASVEAAVKEVKAICSDQGLWAVINNAGLNSMGPAELLPMTSYHRVAEVNLFGPIRVINGCLPLLRQAEGRIVNVLSERAYNHKAYSSPYCLSKAGLLAYSNCLRREMIEGNLGVKVVTVVPGEFATATSIVATKLNDGLRETALREHAKLSLEDQQGAYPLDRVNEVFDGLDPEAMARHGTLTTEPVVRAYVEAVTRLDPRQCYLVHGTAREFWDPRILTIRLRPFLPNCMMGPVEKFLYHVL